MTDVLVAGIPIPITFSETIFLQKYLSKCYVILLTTERGSQAKYRGCAGLADETPGGDAVSAVAPFPGGPGV